MPNDVAWQREACRPVAASSSSSPESATGRTKWRPLDGRDMATQTRENRPSGALVALREPDSIGAANLRARAPSHAAVHTPALPNRAR